MTERAEQRLRAINRAPEIVGQEITKRTQIQKYHHDNPEAKQQDIAKKFRVSQPYVSQVISKNCEVKEKVIVPDWIKSSRDRADFRKLPAELREKSG
jgi:DNA-binding MarR family transcriptional regulator